jgi:hypothetical protein
MRSSNFLLSGLVLLGACQPLLAATNLPSILTELDMTGTVTDFEPINEVLKYVAQQYYADNYCEGIPPPMGTIDLRGGDWRKRFLRRQDFVDFAESQRELGTCKYSYCQWIGCNLCPRRRKLQGGQGTATVRLPEMELLVRDFLSNCEDCGDITTLAMYSVPPGGSPPP